MRLQRQTNGDLITFAASSLIGSGGEAAVYALPQDNELVAKIYHRAHSTRGAKLEIMLATPPTDPMAMQGHTSIAWPIDLLRQPSSKGSIVGFLMRRINNQRTVIDFYHPRTRRQACPLFNYKYLHRTARNLATAVHALHQAGYVVGDVNESNILVAETALVTVVDTDSFQVTNPMTHEIYRCPVGKAEFTPPELQGCHFASVDRVPEHDLFGIAVVMFQLLMEGTLPFGGIYTGSGDDPSYADALASGHFTYGTKKVPYHPKKLAPPFKTLSPILRQLFIQCFDSGHDNPSTRPKTRAWMDALEEAEAELIQCARNDQHQFGSHLRDCPWCERTQLLLGRDPYPSTKAVKSGHHALGAPSQSALPQPSTPNIGWNVPVFHVPTVTSQPTPLQGAATSKSVVKEWGITLVAVFLGLLFLEFVSSGRRSPVTATPKAKFVAPEPTFPRDPSPARQTITLQTKPSYQTSTGAAESTASPHVTLSIPTPKADLAVTRPLTPEPLASPGKETRERSIATLTEIPSRTPSTYSTLDPIMSFPGERHPETRKRVLTIDELQSWPAGQLQYAINEIFARHGADFPDKKVRSVFAKFAWYRPRSDLSFDQIESSLPDVERQNVQVLGSARDTKKSKKEESLAKRIPSQQTPVINQLPPQSQPDYPIAQWSLMNGCVVSPHPPHNLINVAQFPLGELVTDPTTNQVFRTPLQPPDPAIFPIANWSQIPANVVSPYPPHNLLRVDNYPPGALIVDMTTNGVFRRPYDNGPTQAAPPNVNPADVIGGLLQGISQGIQNSRSKHNRRR